MLELSNLQLSTIKRNYRTIDSLTSKSTKLADKVKKEQLKFENKVKAHLVDLREINKTIYDFEQPVLEMTGGYTSQQIVDELHLTEEPKMVKVDGIWILNELYEDISPVENTPEHSIHPQEEIVENEEPSFVPYEEDYISLEDSSEEDNTIQDLY